MKLRSLTAFAALAAAISLAACNGGTSSTGIANVTGQSASIRYVNASPTLGAVDVYYTSAGTTIASTPTQGNLAYGQITDFTTQPATSAQVILRTPGNTTQALGVPCSVPSLSNNGLYTIAFVGQGTAAAPYGCFVYNDIGFTGNGQVRFHNASYNAAASGNSSLALGTVATGSAAGASAQQISNAAGALPTGGLVTVPGFSVPSSGPVTLAVGPVSSTFTATAVYPATFLTAPGSTTSLNTAGTIPNGTYNNASLFAIDCTSTTGTTPQGSRCANGVGLIGTFDSK